MLAPPALSRNQLQQIIALVYQKSGITLHEGKRGMIETRLTRRLRRLGLSDWPSYLRLLSASDSGEIAAFLDVLATNHTSFFRGPEHFAILRDRVLPEFPEEATAGDLEIWSSGCATGEEPYSIAVTCLDAHRERFRILASDLSSRALATAAAGVYPLARVSKLPKARLRRHFERGLGEQAGLARVSVAVRRHVEHRRINLLADDRLDRRFHIVFCRNVMIYFDGPARQRVVSMLERHVLPGGYLFVAHTETLTDLTHDLQMVAPAVYRRAGP